MINIIAEQIAHPWWLTAITGSGGALVVLFMWVKYLTKIIDKQDKQLLEISKNSIECITKIISKYDEDKEGKEKFYNEDKQWRDKSMDILRRIEHFLENRG